MKKSTFTNVIEGVCLALLIPILIALMTASAKAQCSLACNDQVNISLDDDGTAVLQPFMIWEGVLDPVCSAAIKEYSLTVDGIGTGFGVTADCNDLGLHGYSFDVEFYHLDANGGYVYGSNGEPTTYINSCWGEILIEDKVDPTIECADQYLFCNNSVDPEVIGYPAAADNCGIDRFEYEDVYTSLGCQESGNYILVAQIDRTWTVYDLSGNSATCTETLYLFKPSLSELDLPAAINLDCLADASDLSITGQPSFNSVPVVNGDVCKIAANYQDQTITLCGISEKIIRTWTITDWCNGEVLVHNQIIKLLDETAPVITCPADITISTGPFSCDATANLPAITYTDDCSDVTVETTTPQGTLSSNGGVATNLPIGTHTVTYIATDACNNSATCSINVTVEDQVLPTAVCEQHTVVALGPDGTAQVHAIAFDDGSYDNCGDITIEVNRWNAPHCPGDDSSDWGETVEFFCCDAGNTVMVELKITDAEGNFNRCVVNADVQDKMEPVLACPNDITLECRADYTDLTVTGDATAFDNCGIASLTSSDDVNIDNCGAGTVVRTWVAVDNAGLTATCSQTIYIINSDPFDGNDINWPNDYESTNCGADIAPENLPNGFSTPGVDESTCDLVSVTFSDQVLETEGGACLKVLRTWVVVDWCQFEANNDQDGRWEYTQLIKILNEVAPVITSACDNILVCNYEDDCGATYVDLTVTATDDCTPTNDLQYAYEIDYFNDGTIDASAPAPNASGSYPNGTHSITWIVEDGCGNVTLCDYTFTVRDCKKPTPICLNGLSVDLMPTTGSITLWVSDFENGSSYDNCTAYEDLVFSFSPNTNEQSIVFDCNDIGTQIVEIWVTDEDGNQDFCSTYIVVQDNNLVCNSSETTSALIAGRIANEMGEEVENVTVEVNSSYAFPFITGVDGGYAFPNLPMHDDYTIAPEKDMNPMNGISTYDLVLMTKHILGVSSLDSPYKLIAADANNSGSLTTLDIVTLRKMILGIDTEFVNNTSWRFVDANYTFANPSNPFASAFPEVVSINDLDENAAADFVAIKVGDVNDSAIPNTLLGTQSRTTAGSLVFDIDDKELKAGEEYTVNFTARDAALGYQFTLDFDVNALAFVDVANATTDNFGLTRVNEGIITTSWNEAQATKAIFSLTFKAMSDVQLSKALKISSQYTTAEAYNEAAELLDVNLAFNTATATTVASTEFALYQNTPNPFKTTTNVAFNLAEAGTATLTIFDLSGKVLKVYNGKFAKGLNEVTINRNELAGTGVVYYQLETTTDAATMKMLLVD